jgi:hypothetical protein
MPRDESNLVLSPEDKDMIAQDPRAKKFIKKYIGAAEFIRGNDRYCLWITASDYEEAKTIPAINERMEKVAEFRAKSKAKSTQDYASRPYRFVQISYKPTNSIFVPSTARILPLTRKLRATSSSSIPLASIHLGCTLKALPSY